MNPNFPDPESTIIPEHVQIEPVGGACTAACPMCTIDIVKRNPTVMAVETFELILKKFLPYKDKIKLVSSTGMGESLLDKNLHTKIAIARDLGFSGRGFTTNATNLTEERSRAVIYAGLQTLICSIDGIKKETHETIRPRTKFEVVRSNVENFLKIRDELKAPTRLVVRFVRQQLNKDEWPAYQKYWSDRIDRARGDLVVKFDVQNWGGSLEDYQDLDVNEGVFFDKAVCEDVFRRIWIHSDGGVALCCADESRFYKIGNVIEEDPIKVYNSEVFRKHRKMMLAGRIGELDHCKDCTMPRSRYLRDGVS